MRKFFHLSSDLVRTIKREVSLYFDALSFRNRVRSPAYASNYDCSRSCSTQDLRGFRDGRYALNRDRDSLS